MTYSVRMLADSVASCGSRLSTMEVVMPRFLLPEFNTHRKLSRNSASSRAIPVGRRIEQVLANPFVPESFGKNRSGMQADGVVDPVAQFESRDAWLRARDACVAEARKLVQHEVHKQHANRLIELWAWHTVVVTASDYRNFLALRDHKGAQPEMQITAHMMRESYERSQPESLIVGDRHLPYLDEYDWGSISEQAEPFLVKKSVVCCAAVSYERQDAERSDEKILERHDEMVRMAHWSPFEHQAKIANEREIEQYALYRRDADGSGFTPVSIGNFDVPWLQYRKTFEGEAVFKP
jgi:thymidylate synthase ThyX